MVLVENYEAHHQNWVKCFNNPQMSDIVFQARDGQTFHCQKFVLEVASPHFKKFFSSGQCRDSSKFVSAIDVDPDALKWILRACYTGDGDLDDDNVVGVMLAAKSYEMGWVEKACMKYLSKDNAGPVAKFEYSKENEKWQEWKVPKTSWYHIVAMGSKAVDGKTDAYLFQAKGGEGAIIGASFELVAGDVIQILTGGMSRLYSKNLGFGGGGGGTFVALKRKEPHLLLAAGGGGGIHLKYYGCDASLSESGSATIKNYPGGKNGGNGASYSIYGGGLGWNAGPAALAKPTTTSVTATGGFGGGGGVLGGGGGYSGGGSGYSFGGGGGGSYVAYEASNYWKRAGNSGVGKVYVWSGRQIPVEETFFLKQVGRTDEGAKTHEQSLDTWEVIE